MINKLRAGISALRNNWQSDLGSGASAALVALPLSMGIAIAAGLPAVSGLFAAIVGGFVGSVFSGTHVGIKGPSAALIPVIIAATTGFLKDVDNSYSVLLAAFMFSGGVQMLLGLLRLGVIGDFFPASVVKGILASVGLIILAKQIGPGLGVEITHSSNLDILLNIGNYLLKLNPFVTIITLNGLAILILMPRVRNKMIRAIPPTMWVLLVAFPFTFLFGLKSEWTIELLNAEFSFGPDNLIQIPDSLLAEINMPSFGMLGSIDFWLLVLTITLVSTIENLAATKAIEKLDPFQRKSALNRDLLNSGFSTILSALFGGLPVITVIARTSVNINHGAKTTWSNFFHGLLCLLAIGLFGKWFENIPLAALSAILLYTGYKLASPKVFRDSYFLGIEQIIILLTTILVTLGSGSIPLGILIGIGTTLLIHLIRSGMSWQTFLKYLLHPKLKVVKEDQGRYLIRVKGIANFVNVIRLRRTLSRIPKKKQMVMDFSNTRLVDYTALEFLHDYQVDYNKAGGNFEILGIDAHESSSPHPYSLHIHRPERLKRLTKRQMHFELLAHKNGWQFNPQMDWETDHFRKFHFFDTRPVEYKKNTIAGQFKEIETRFEISDITFDEGALLATEVYRSTMQIIELPFAIPTFVMEREHMMDRILELAGGGDIDFSDHKKFSKKVLLHSDEAENVHEFFSKELLDFFASHTIYHIESTGSSLLLFQNFRLASVEMVEGMIDFSHELTANLHKLRNAMA